MKTPNTTQQLYKVISSQHREMCKKHWETLGEIDRTQELTADSSRHARNDLYEAQRMICRRIDIGFGACVVLILLSSWLDRLNRIDFENSMKLVVEQRDVLIPPTATRDPYLLNLTNFGSCKAYTVSRVVYYDPDGVPVTKRNDVMFTLPGMPECKPQ